MERSCCKGYGGVRDGQRVGGKQEGGINCANRKEKEKRVVKNYRRVTLMPTL